MQSGIARGLFSNEAGMGSAANVAASATPNPESIRRTRFRTNARCIC